MAVPTRHLMGAPSAAADPEAEGPDEGTAEGMAEGIAEGVDQSLDEGLLCALVRAVDAMVCVIDGDGRILLANPAMHRFTGTTAADLIGRPFWDVVVAPEHVLLAQDAVARAMATGRAHPQEGDWLTATGERRRVAVSNTVLAEGGRPYAIGCVARDVTDDRRREEQLHRRAQTDLLTGIANRAALFDALGHCLDEADGAGCLDEADGAGCLDEADGAGCLDEADGAGCLGTAGGVGCAVLFCDLDDFKWVNDEHGHAMGDRVLTEVAARLVEVTGPDDLVARFGGDEFVILCPRPDEAALTALAAGIVARVDEAFPGPDGPLRVGMSVGVAVARPGESADDLIGRADRAMYGVKTHQRRRLSRPAPVSGGAGSGGR